MMTVSCSIALKNHPKSGGTDLDQRGIHPPCIYQRIQGQEGLLIISCSGCLEVCNMDLNCLFPSILTYQGNERGEGNGLLVLRSLLLELDSMNRDLKGEKKKSFKISGLGFCSKRVCFLSVPNVCCSKFLQTSRSVVKTYAKL